MTSTLTVVRCPQRRQGDLFALPACVGKPADGRSPPSRWAELDPATAAPAGANDAPLANSLQPVLVDGNAA